MHIFSGIYKGRLIATPKGEKTRPTCGRLRESLFNICQCIEPPFSFLDAFSGSGAIGLEALSRGASHVTFIDNSRESIQCIKKNVLSLKVDGLVEIIYGDVIETLAKLAMKNKMFDIIYADPPYNLGLGLQTLKAVDALTLLKASGCFFLEEAANVIPDDLKLDKLLLKKSRKMGKSSLWHYHF